MWEIGFALPRERPTAIAREFNNGSAYPLGRKMSPLLLFKSLLWETLKDNSGCVGLACATEGGPRLIPDLIRLQMFALRLSIGFNVWTIMQPECTTPLNFLFDRIREQRN